MRKALRFIWYLFSRILVWAAIVPIVVLSFFAAMDYMNVRILTSDGLKARADYIIKGDDPTQFSKVFSKGFLDEDNTLHSNEYRLYVVSDFDYDLEIPIAIIFPWNKSVTLRVKESIEDIKGEVYPGTENNTEISETPPEWQNAVYDIKLVRYEDNWRIVSMELVELLPEPSPSPSQETQPNDQE